MLNLTQALKLQREKENLMTIEKIIREHGGIEVEPIELYKDMFQIGDGMIQRHSKSTRDLVANPLIYMKNNAEARGQYRILFEDQLEELLELAGTFDFAITNGITYFGRKNTQEHASKMFAMIFDLDGVGEREAINLFSGIEAYKSRIYPMPNYMVMSGHGLHLYYLFDWALPLYPNIKLQLKNFKYGMTRCLWNGNTSQIKTPQYQGINQGFRIAGGKTKIEGFRSKVFRFNTHPWTLKQLCEYVPKEYWIDEDKLFRETKLSLEEAKRRFPDWYQRRVLDKMPKRSWRCKEDLYNWWYRRIKEEARFGHRYFCVMMLAIYAMKCGIPKERLEADAFAIQNDMTALNPLEPFTDADIKSALECYDERYLTFPIKDIAQLTTMPITKNKRNHQPQADHLEEARALRDIRMKRQGKKWDDNNGRKTKQSVIQEWRKNNPEGTKYQCSKETGTDKKTVRKWWDSE